MRALKKDELICDWLQIYLIFYNGPSINELIDVFFLIRNKTELSFEEFIKSEYFTNH